MSVNVPIKTVTPASDKGVAIGSPITGLPAPVKSDWGKSDLSAPGAGRMESGRTLKKRVGKVDKLEIEWQMMSKDDAAFILQTFDHEYTLVEYLDARQGLWVTKHFYTGDMQASGWIPHMQLWRSVTLSIIQSTPTK